jgi:cell division protein FtsA
MLYCFKGGIIGIMNEIVAGIDIGSSKICTILGEMNKNNQLQILGVGTAECKGLKKGIIVDIDDAANAIKSSIDQVERMSNMEIKAAYINIAGGHTTLIRNRGVIAISRDDSEITQDDLERVLQAAMLANIPIDKEVIGVMPLQFIVDGYEHIKDPVGMIGVRLEVDAYIIVAASAYIQNLVRSVQRCNINVLGIVIDPLASSEVILTKDEKELGVVLVDVGAEITDISIFKGAALIYTKLIPVGGAHITNDISIGLKIPTSEAEVLKRQYGYAAVSMLKSIEEISINSTINSNIRKIDNRELVDIIEARVQEIYYLINNELESSEYKESICGGMVITGGGLAFIKGSLEIASSTIGLPVRVGAPSYIGVASSIYSTGTGIVKYVLSSRKNNGINKYSSSETSSVSKAKVKKQTADKSLSIITTIKDFFTDFF